MEALSRMRWIRGAPGYSPAMRQSSWMKSEQLPCPRRVAPTHLFGSTRQHARENGEEALIHLRLAIGRSAVHQGFTPSPQVAIDRRDNCGGGARQSTRYLPARFAARHSHHRHAPPQGERAAAPFTPTDEGATLQPRKTGPTFVPGRDLSDSWSSAHTEPNGMCPCLFLSPRAPARSPTPIENHERWFRYLRNRTPFRAVPTHSRVSFPA